MLGLRLNHISKRGPWWPFYELFLELLNHCQVFLTQLMIVFSKVNLARPRSSKKIEWSDVKIDYHDSGTGKHRHIKSLYGKVGIAFDFINWLAPVWCGCNLKSKIYIFRIFSKLLSCEFHNISQMVSPHCWADVLLPSGNKQLSESRWTMFSNAILNHSVTMSWTD